MKLLKKRWFKILISLLLGGIFSEIISILTEDNIIRNFRNPALIIAAFFYVFITLFIWVYHFWIYRENSNKESELDNIIDEDF